MKTSIIQKQVVGLFSTRRAGRQSGFAGKAVLVVLVLAGLAAGALYLRSKNEALPEKLLTSLTQVVSSPVSGEAGSPPAENAALPESASAEPSGSPAAGPGSPPVQARSVAPAPAAPAAPLGPRTAPPGTVYLTKRVTVTTDTGMSSFPRGTLAVVTSRKGGKIQASVRGVSLELAEAETATVIED